MQNKNAALLKSLGIEEWNNMQQAAHDTIAKEKNVLLLAPTGSGKTLAYLVPVLYQMKSGPVGAQCLILVPSRELALQIEQVWKKMATGFKVNTFYGGHLLQTELQNLSTPPALIVGTPGRIADHMRRGSFEVDGIHTLVLDEFDKSLALGFEEEMSYITGQLMFIKKRILVSATAAIEIPEFTGVKDPVVLDYSAEEQVTKGLELKTVISEDKDKIESLFNLLCYIGAESTIVFCNHREPTERISAMLKERGIENAYFHGGMEQPDREQTLVKFRNGTIQFLIATDLAARGLDIPAVKHVVHYHIPVTKEEFIHRNGRTARMNTTGTAYMILHTEETLPEYIEETPEEVELPEKPLLPATPQWVTLYISGGKKDKLNKVDIVGFFSKVGSLERDELGLIDVQDYISFAAVKKSKVKDLLSNIKEEKMKGKYFKIAIAK